MHDLDWQDLRHFAAFVRGRSLSAAAKELAVDHVTVARRLDALEKKLRVRLLDRRQHVPVLTSDGERIAAAVLQMEAASDGVARAARGLAPDLDGAVSISAPPTMVNELIAPRLGTLRKRFPELQIHLLSEKRVASLARREADVALRLVKPTESELVIRRLGRFEFRLFAHRAYAAKPASQHEFIAFDPSAEALPQNAWLLRHAGARPIVLRTNDLESQLAAARAQLGVLALPEYVAKRYPELVPVRSRLRPIARELWLVVHEDLRGLPSVRAVIDFLCECTAELH
jgi:DNA-binding transcriptional LysR family regulator